MRSIVNGAHYNTTTATTIYEWAGISLCRCMQGLFLRYHYKGYTDHIKPISYDEAVLLLQSKGDPRVISLLHESGE
ncbi:hypothetical protein ACFL3F_03370 [Planctomycetota bacterium]